MSPVRARYPALIIEVSHLDWVVGSRYQPNRYPALFRFSERPPLSTSMPGSGRRRACSAAVDVVPLRCLACVCMTQAVAGQARQLGRTRTGRRGGGGRTGGGEGDDGTHRSSGPALGVPLVRRRKRGWGGTRLPAVPRRSLLRWRTRVRPRSSTGTSG